MPARILSLLLVALLSPAAAGLAADAAPPSLGPESASYDPNPNRSVIQLRIPDYRIDAGQYAQLRVEGLRREVLSDTRAVIYPRDGVVCFPATTWSGEPIILFSAKYPGRYLLAVIAPSATGKLDYGETILTVGNPGPGPNPDPNPNPNPYPPGPNPPNPNPPGPYDPDPARDQWSRWAAKTMVEKVQLPPQERLASAQKLAAAVQEVCQAAASLEVQEARELFARKTYEALSDTERQAWAGFSEAMAHEIKKVADAGKLTAARQYCNIWSAIAKGLVSP